MQLVHVQAAVAVVVVVRCNEYSVVQRNVVRVV